MHRVFLTAILLAGLTLLTACNSLEGALYQAQLSENKACDTLADARYKEMMAYMGDICLLHGQYARMAGPNASGEEPGLRQDIYHACRSGQSVTIETIMLKNYGAPLDGDLPGVAADSPACRP